MLRSKLNYGSLQCYYIYGHLHAVDCGSFWKFINFTLRLRLFLLITNYFPCQSLKDEETFNIWFPLVLFSSDCISESNCKPRTHICMHVHTHTCTHALFGHSFPALGYSLLLWCRGCEWWVLFFFLRKEWEWEIARYPGKGCHKEL